MCNRWYAIAQTGPLTLLLLLLLLMSGAEIVGALVPEIQGKQRKGDNDGNDFSTRGTPRLVGTIIQGESAVP